MKVLSPSCKVVLYKSTPTASGTYPVKIRVTFDRESKYYSLGVYCGEEAFNDDGVNVPRINRGSPKDNNKIKAQFEKAEEAIKSITAKGKDFTFHLFEQEYGPARSFRKLGMVGEFIDFLVVDMEKNERYSTALTYKDCKSSLEAYKKGLKINQIDLKFLNDYTRNLHGRLSPASVGIHLRTLRAVINAAIEKKLIPKGAYAFEGFKGIPKNKSRSKKALTKERIKELVDHWRKLSKKQKFSSQWQSLSLFLFSYFSAGINLEDIIRLTDKSLKEGNLRFVRAKTKSEIEIPLTEIGADVLADFSQVSDQGYLFPFLEKKLPSQTIRWRKMNLLKKINADLKTIAGDLGISPFTFYSARHSFASVLHNEGTPTSDIGDMLGHTSEATTRNYIASIQTERKKEAFGKLI